MGLRLPRGRKRVLWLAAAVVVGAGGVGAWLVVGPSAAEPTPQDMTATATSGTQRRTVAATGTVQPAHKADLAFGVSGEVTGVLVAEGDTVTAGQVLATVDDELLRAEVDAAESTLDAAEARRDDDTAADASDPQLAADDAAVVSARSRLTAAQDSLDQARLRATIAGTVVAVDVAVGDRVGGDQPSGDSPTEPDDQSDGSTTAQVTVVSTNRYVVEASVASSDVERVEAGQQAEITPVDATEPVEGTVTTVGLVAETADSGAATFPVTVDVTGERDDIFARSSATVSIVVEERENVLTVPSQALHSDGDTTYVYKIVGGERTRTVVEIGTAYGPQTEIVSGLAEGDEVEIAGFTRPPGGGGGDSDDQGPRVFPGGGGGQVPGGGMIPGGGGK
ncbi:MAG: biotin/lipoyl-binding protein [Actinophytocola sp.]|uniref:efflux RND transporter periplasmic adaptor subunit n=1 Tax=Actinophytocola sp. TaxID=1872138 RepID=UPI00132C40FD|nr:biotin/lipoyl-binding protein [Actinophytocola sp.]MPZ83803.1 biotin/lipoyl-binding protein [Actinophytocola sp.]